MSLNFNFSGPGRCGSYYRTTSYKHPPRSSRFEKSILQQIISLNRELEDMKKKYKESMKIRYLIYKLEKHEVPFFSSDPVLREKEIKNFLADGTDLTEGLKEIEEIYYQNKQDMDLTCQQILQESKEHKDQTDEAVSYLKNSSSAFENLLNELKSQKKCDKKDHFFFNTALSVGAIAFSFFMYFVKQP